MCYDPYIGWLVQYIAPDGKKYRKLINLEKERGNRYKLIDKQWKVKARLMDKQGYMQDPTSITIPCGKCQECLINFARDWAIRCALEAKQYQYNQFITLTYNNDNFPPLGVSKDVISKFVRAVRDKYRKKGHKGIRYFGCGEYGSQYARPHYHILFFNLPPWGDEEYLKAGKGGSAIYISKELEKLWGKGFCTIGKVTAESAAYVARYTIKKQNFEKPKAWADEFRLMSRNPGIARSYINENWKQIYEFDEIIHDGKSYKPPRYFDKCLENYINEGRLDDVKADREQNATRRLQNVKANKLTRKEVLRQNQYKSEQKKALSLHD